MDTNITVLYNAVFCYSTILNNQLYTTYQMVLIRHYSDNYTYNRYLPAAVVVGDSLFTIT